MMESFELLKRLQKRLARQAMGSSGLWPMNQASHVNQHHQSANILAYPVMRTPELQFMDVGDPATFGKVKYMAGYHPAGSADYPMG